MRSLPAHGNLDNAVQVLKSGFPLNQQAPPDRGLRAIEGHFDLIDSKLSFSQLMAKIAKNASEPETIANILKLIKLADINWR
jgi:hypothetical protein